MPHPSPHPTRHVGVASVSEAAALKAGAASLGIPLYRHIGGVNACTLPVPGEISFVGSDRYGSGKRSGSGQRLVNRIRTIGRRRITFEIGEKC